MTTHDTGVNERKFAKAKFALGKRGISADTCGCAMGARFLIGSLVAASLWYGFTWHAYGPGIARIALRIVAWSFCGALLGKIIGMIAARIVPSRA